MVTVFYRYCRTLEEWIDIDKPCPLPPPSECLYKDTNKCPLEKEKELRKHEQPIR